MHDHVSLYHQLPLETPPCFGEHVQMAILIAHRTDIFGNRYE